MRYYWYYSIFNIFKFCFQSLLWCFSQKSPLSWFRAKEQSANLGAFQNSSFSAFVLFHSWHRQKTGAKHDPNMMQVPGNRRHNECIPNASRTHSVPRCLHFSLDSQSGLEVDEKGRTGKVKDRPRIGQGCQSVIGLPFHGRDLHGSSLWLLFGLLFSHHGLCLGAQRNFHTSAKIRASCPALKLEPHIVLLCILTTSDNFWHTGCIWEQWAFETCGQWEGWNAMKAPELPFQS